jgi:translocation and assembly module TamB
LGTSGASARPGAGARRRRWVRRLGLGVLLLAVLAVVLVAGAVALVATPWGGERLRAFVVQKANATIQGTIAARRLSLRGGHLLLEGVELRDPDGVRVASASALEVRLRLLPLVRRRIDLALVRVDRPELQLHQDATGTNLQRALASRNPAPEVQEESQGNGLAFSVEEVQIARGVVDVVQRGEGSSLHVRVNDLAVRGNASVIGAALAARLTASGTFQAPFDGPLDVRVDAAGADARKDVRASLQLGTAKLAGTASVEDEGRASVSIESLVVPPDIARAFLPSYPLRAPASLVAHARREGDRISVQLDASAGSARARIEGDYSLDGRRIPGTTATVRHVDLAELVGGPASDVALDLVAEGGGTSLEDLAGRLEVRVPPSRMGRDTMGPVHLLATAEKGEVRISELRIHVPGVRVDAGGRIAKDRLAVSGNVLADDLAAFGRTLGSLAGPGAASLRGRGQLAFAVAGTPGHPSLVLRGAFPVVVHQGTRVDGLSLEVGAPDLRAPTGANAHLAARTVALAPAKVFRRARLEFESQGHDLVLDAEVHGYAELSLSARATLAPGGRAGTLTALDLRYPEARWALESPVQLEMRGGSLALSPLTLRSGPQAISARLQKRGTRLDAALALQAVDLARLPRAFVDPALGLGGVLDVDVRAEGAAARPEVRANVALRDGRFKRFRRVQLHLEGSYAKDQAKGTLAADGQGMRLTGTFDVPVKALQQGRRVPVKVELAVDELRLDDSLRELGVTNPVTGLVSAQVSMGGTADDPRLQVSIKAWQLRMRQVPPSDVELALSTGDDGRLRARVDLALDGRKSFVEVRTPFTAGELMRNPPDREALLARPFALDAELRELPLELLSRAGLTSRPVGGVVSARARLAGTGAAPRGELSVTGTKLTTRGLEPVDARLQVNAGDGLSADLRADQGGKAIVEARLRAGVAAGQLRDAARLAEAPLSIEADVGPLSLSRMQAAFQPEDIDPTQAPPRIRGELTARLAASGTLRDPRAAFHARVDGLGADRSPDGAAEVTLDYAAAREKLEVVLRSQDRGELRATAATRLDLSYPAVTRTPELAGAPVEATLRAADFDPGFLANLTGAFEKLGGLVYADARVGGTLGAPAVNGTLEWKDGIVFTHGNGDFTNVHLRARGDNDRLQLEELSARSGRGTAKLAALATRTGSAAFRLHATADLDKLPVMSEGQVTATISLRSTADGEISGWRVLVRDLRIPEAHVQLPDVEKKDVQKLDDPSDVVLTIAGKPVRGTKRRSPQASADAGAAAMGTGSVGGAEAADGAGRNPSVAIRVNAPRNLWIHGGDVNTEIGLSEGFLVEYAGGPRLSGDVNVIRGRLDVFGRRFDFQRDSKVSFSGPPTLPDLDVTTAYRNEIEGVTVNLKVQGQADRIELKPTSEPPLSETEIYTLLATGHTSLRHGSGASSPSGQAASLVGSLAASQLKKTLSSKLPLDVLSIEAGDNGLEGTKLEAGTYVNDRLYVGFTGRFGADPMRGENSNAVNLEYQLTKRWSANGSYGDAGAGAAGVTWRKDY